MPYRNDNLPIADLRTYEALGLLRIKFEEAEAEVSKGAKLYQVCSSFTDFGSDYTEVYLEYPDDRPDQKIARMEGF